MAEIFVWGVLAGLLVNVSTYGACKFLQFVRMVPDGIGE